MDRVIPKDLLDLIYKESYLDKIKRLNEEYHQFFAFSYKPVNDTVILIYKDKHYSLGIQLNDRELPSHYTVIRNFKLRRNSGILPKRYIYSSGHSILKWKE